MDALDKSFSDLVGILKSWIPWRPESANVSRDFWMPYHSCSVCYDCDSQFTLFTRRHHCRLCGRVFCGGCTSNCVPAPSSEPRTTCEDWDKIRVCNYCFKQWEQGLAATINNGIQASSLDLSSSPTATSFISTKSSDSADCSTTIASMQHSSGSYQQNPYPSEINPHNCRKGRCSNIKEEQGSRDGNVSQHFNILHEQVTSKHLKGGKESKMDVLVMENLLFGRNLTRLYDLKGSSRSRYNPDSSGNNKVLLDQNLIEAMPTSPIFVGNKAKRLLERAVWNDGFS